MRHTPAVVPNTNGNGVVGLRPSFARASSIAAAAVSPAAIPPSFSAPARDRGERGGVLGRQVRERDRLIGGNDGDENSIRRSRDGSIFGVPWIGLGLDEVRLIAAVDSVDGVVDGALDHRKAQRGRMCRRVRCENRSTRIDVPLRYGIGPGDCGRPKNDQRSGRGGNATGSAKMHLLDSFRLRRDRVRAFAPGAHHFLAP